MQYGGKRGEGRFSGGGLFPVFFGCLVLFSGAARGQLYPSDVLILVNENSATSRYIARLYREYYPEAPESQVLGLSGLADCSGPGSTAADEIITRQQYEQCIAGPVRAYLIENDLVNTIRVIVTTAGVPYRIEDSSNGSIVEPAASTAYAGSGIPFVDAASVESELTVLFQSDTVNNPGHPLPVNNRVVNPYQGYRSGIDVFSRDIPGNTGNLNWLYPRRLSPSHYPPIMDGDRTNNLGVAGRSFSGGDIYLTCRLDGPKRVGQTAVFAVRAMLERSKRASSSEVGINPAHAVTVFDDAPGASDHDYNRIYNLDYGAAFLVYDPCVQQPPDTELVNKSNDYTSGFQQMTGGEAVAEVSNSGFMSVGGGMKVICDRRAAHRTNQGDLAVGELVAAAASFGRNGDEGSTKSYPFEEGPNGGALFNCTNGTVFTSIESYNGVTMFRDAETTQAKIIDFLEIGATGAIGHSFEPYEDAIIDNEFVFYNLFADSDGDGRADMTFAEAAFTGIPYLSWSEVVVGDPLMQIRYGPGQKAWTPLLGDVNRDGRVNLGDVLLVKGSLGGRLNTTSQASFDLYSDAADINQDGIINYGDTLLVKSNLGARADW